jgi:hypothetical protein
VTNDLRRRSAAEVFEDHLQLAGRHLFAEDIERNVYTIGTLAQPFLFRSSFPDFDTSH